MSSPYLIAHLVHGTPAFDIAEQIEIGDEQGWIIPTSGHRAYPYWHEQLDRAVDWGMVHVNAEAGLGMPFPLSPPADWPDHYSLTAAPKGTGAIAEYASAHKNGDQT